MRVVPLALALVLLSTGEARAGDDLPESALARLGSPRLRLPGTVEDIALSRDGRALAAASHDSIAVFETGTWKELLRVACRPSAVAVSPDGTIVTDGANAWEVGSGALLYRDQPTGSTIAFSPDGKLVAVASDTVRLREARTGRELMQLLGHERRVSALAFSPDGKLLATGGEEGSIRLRSTATGSTVLCLRGHARQIRGLAFSGDGKTLASAADGARLWNVETGALVRALDARCRSEVFSVAFAPDGRLLGWVANALVSWETASGEPGKPLEVDGSRSFAVSPDGSFLFTASAAGVRVVDLATGEPREPEGHSGEVCSLVFSRDGALVLSASGDRTLRLWEACSGKPLWTKKVAPQPRALGFSPDGKSVLASAEGGLVLDAATGKEIRSFRGFDASMSGGEAAVAASPNASLLAARREHGGDSIRLFDPGSARQLRELEHLDARSEKIDLAFVKGGEALAAVVASSVNVFSVVTGDAQRAIVLSKRELGPVAVSSDAIVVAYLGEGGSVLLQDSATGDIRRLARPDARARVSALAFSPDGKLLAWGREDGAVRVSDLADEKRVLVLSGHSSAVSCLAFSPDGNRLASGSVDCTALVWDMASALARADAPPAPAPATGYEDVRAGERYVFASSDGTLEEVVGARRDGEIEFFAGTQRVPRTVRIAKAPSRPDPGSGKLVGREVLEVSGRRFECQIREAADGSRTWVAPRYPFVIRRTNAAGAVKLELREIKDSKGGAP
ncbi:hypothetical protein HY251_05760 [bacterium]|nr:hypothetical protein [bacterium]